jgi:hypothetical protein
MNKKKIALTICTIILVVVYFTQGIIHLKDPTYLNSSCYFGCSIIWLLILYLNLRNKIW